MHDDPYWLNKIMEPGHVIRVRGDGTIGQDVPGVHAPELVMGTAGDKARSVLTEHEEAYAADARAQGWEILTGWSAQDRYRGLCMHPSEFVGGALARHITETPGLWVVIDITCDDGEDTGDEGWAIAHRPEHDQED